MTKGREFSSAWQQAFFIGALLTWPAREKDSNLPWMSPQQNHEGEKDWFHPHTLGWFDCECWWVSSIGLSITTSFILQETLISGYSALEIWQTFLNLMIVGWEASSFSGCHNPFTSTNPIPNPTWTAITHALPATISYLMLAEPYPHCEAFSIG